MKLLWFKMREVVSTVLPVAALVVVLHFSVAPMPTGQITVFFSGLLFILIGLSLFLIGVDHTIVPLGNLLSGSIARSNRKRLLIAGGFLIGFFVSVAEPDLQILAEQVAFVSGNTIGKWTLVVTVSVGIGIMLVAGLSRMLYRFSLKKLLLAIYTTITVLSIFISLDFLAVSFDASGATTGAVAVPFIMAVAAGISSIKKDSREGDEDSFGLVGIVSTGAILSVMLVSVVMSFGGIENTVRPDIYVPQSVPDFLPGVFFISAKDSSIAIMPLLVIFLIGKKFLFEIRKKKSKYILTGFVLSWIGLIIFLTGVNIGFLSTGRLIGAKIASLDKPPLLLIIGFIMGFLTVIAEPAVHVLTYRIEEVTTGMIRRKLVLIALASGVGTAVMLSAVRILVDDLQLWHILLPGYVLAIVLMKWSSSLFVGIAFDSGGVASGPMTATFILAFMQGAAEMTPGADVVADGFGVIALVAMTPLVALQVLGFLYHIREGEIKR